MTLYWTIFKIFLHNYCSRTGLRVEIRFAEILYIQIILG